MRDDADFAAYVAARWTPLVRTLVLIGCPRDDADDVAVEGLARCYASWHRIREEADVDVQVYGVVLDVWHRSHRADEAREAHVLRNVAGLSDLQVADVLDIASAPSSGTDLGGAADEIQVGPAPYDAVLARVAERRRRRRRILLAAGTATVVVAGVLTWVSLRPGPEPEVPQPKVVEARNPVDLPWYGDGRLQLRTVAVELPAVTQLVSVGGGAAYVDDDGDLAFAGPTGHVTALGRTPLGSPVVASDERGWVAWVDSDGKTELVVHDVVRDEDVAHVDVLPGARLVALDQNNVFFISEDRTHVWEPLTGRVEDIGARELLDVESAVRVYGNGVQIDMVQPFFDVDFRRAGVTADLSPGGVFVLSRPAGQLDQFTPLLYDARSGNRLVTGLYPGDLALDAAFGPDDTVDYLVVTEPSSGLAVLRTCGIQTPGCVDVVPLRRDEVEPLLAH